MDKLGVYYDNIQKFLVISTKKVPVVRRFGHAFLIWEYFLHTFVTSSFNTNPCLLTETELRRIHRRFGHPSTNRLYNVLQRSGHDSIDKKIIDHLTKFCSNCQKHKGPPKLFKFNLRDAGLEFIHSIVVDIMYIDSDPVLHIVDIVTKFQAARWLQNLSAKHTWDKIRNCWIGVYIGPPDFIVTDAGTNFTSKEFHQTAASMAVSVKNVPVEAH
ncbi:hypothetical protein K3495_g1305 [Podosphaera aphanis]|nr:hypothetical protein K3495_g1305 [Podosphaera aphanis]